MNVEPTEEQTILKDSVAKFRAAEIPTEKIREMAEEPTGLTEELWQKIADQGWLGVLFPEQYGGLELGVTELAIIAEEFGRGVVPGPFFASAVLGGPAIAIGGTEALKAEWLEKIATGKAKATLALIEEEAELGPQAVRAKAEKSAEGYRITGKKFFVPNLIGADVVVVAARTGQGEDGTTLFAVRTGAPGVALQENKLTDQTSRSGQLVLDGVEVGEADVIGEVGQGWKVAEQVLALANVALAAECVAGAEQILETTIAYARERTQFGVPIGVFQGVKHPLANLFAEIESARSAYHYAAWAVDASSEDVRQAVAVARLTATEAYRRTTLDCLQAHGGIGFTWEYDLHLYLKRAKHNQYFLGVNGDYEEIIVREALGI